MRRTRSPPTWQLSGPRHGPLPVLLLCLTVVTAMVDAVSVLRLGRVFVANMTGNLVFAGFAIAGAPGFVLSSSLFALVGFVVGAVLGGVLIARSGRDRALLLGVGVTGELVLVAVALAVAVPAGDRFDAPTRVSIAGLLAIAMGVQNAIARKLAVPDLNTTLITMDIVGITSGWGEPNRRAAFSRRLLAVVTLLVGAVVGGSLVLEASPAAALAVATGLLAIVAAGVVLAARRPGEWRESLA